MTQPVHKTASKTAHAHANARTREEDNAWEPMGFEPREAPLRDMHQARATSGITGANVMRHISGGTLQYRASKPTPGNTADAQATAAAGLEGAAQRLPYFDVLQASFGRFDLSNVRAHTGPQARDANAAMGSLAYATGEDVAFGPQPTLFTAAHEAAHVIQQRSGITLSGGVGQTGDRYERHADAVAERVARGESAEALLAQYEGGAGVGERRGVQLKEEDACTNGPPTLDTSDPNDVYVAIDGCEKELFNPNIPSVKFMIMGVPFNAKPEIYFKIARVQPKAGHAKDTEQTGPDGETQTQHNGAYVELAVKLTLGGAVTLRPLSEEFPVYVKFALEAQPEISARDYLEEKRWEVKAGSTTFAGKVIAGIDCPGLEWEWQIGKCDLVTISSPVVNIDTDAWSIDTQGEYGITYPFAKKVMDFFDDNEDPAIKLIERALHKFKGSTTEDLVDQINSSYTLKNKFRIYAGEDITAVEALFYACTQGTAFEVFKKVTPNGRDFLEFLGDDGREALEGVCQRMGFYWTLKCGHIVGGRKTLDTSTSAKLSGDELLFHNHTRNDFSLWSTKKLTSNKMTQDTGRNAHAIQLHSRGGAGTARHWRVDGDNDIMVGFLSPVCAWETAQMHGAKTITAREASWFA